MIGCACHPDPSESARDERSRGVCEASKPSAEALSAVEGDLLSERRILREPLGVVDILIARHPTVEGLAQQVRQRQPCILPQSGQVLFDEFTEPLTFVNSRTRIRPPSEVTRDPWKCTLHEGGRKAERAVLVSYPLAVNLRSASIRLKPA